MLTLIQKTHQIDKPIFSSESYLNSLIAFCDLCFALIDSRTEFYFLCQTCENFAVCFTCIKNPQHRLITHASNHLFYADKPYSNTHWINRNLSITCQLCREKNFPGKRYQCRQCLDYNICSKCFNQAKLIHYPWKKHLLDFIPNPTKIRFNRHLLAERTIQYLRHRNGHSFDRDEITGWTIEEANIISQQTLALCSVAWKEAVELFQDEDIDAPANIIEHEKFDRILVAIATN